MGSCRPLAALLCLTLCAVWAPSRIQAQIQPTTEFGITVTPEDIWNTIDESRRFWTGVRNHVTSDKFATTDLEARKQAAEYLKKIDGEISKRALAEATVRDVLDFLASRVRKYQIYRDLRTSLGNDAIFYHLRETWEDERLHINVLPVAEQAAASELLMQKMQQEMTAAQLPAAQIEASLPNWIRLQNCMDRINQLGCGQLIIAYEKQVRQGDPKVAKLMRSIVRAADWAIITKPTNDKLNSTHFHPAWDACNNYERVRTARK